MTKKHQTTRGWQAFVWRELRAGVRGLSRFASRCPDQSQSGASGATFRAFHKFRIVVEWPVCGFYLRLSVI
jgi:hypothetical protein